MCGVPLLIDGYTGPPVPSTGSGMTATEYLGYGFWFLTEEIQYHDGLRSRELGQASILLCAPNS